jgi:hypothetical protein
MNDLFGCLCASAVVDLPKVASSRNRTADHLTLQEQDDGEY